jgi:hypothetical protein
VFADSSGEKRPQEEDLAQTPKKRPSMGRASPSKAAAAGPAAGTASTGPSPPKKARGGSSKYMPLKSPKKQQAGRKVETSLAKAKELTMRARASVAEAARPVKHRHVSAIRFCY